MKTPTMIKLSLLLLALLAVPSAIGLARDELADDSPTTPAVSDGPTLEGNDFGPFTESARSLQQLVDASVLVAKVRPVRQLEDYWPEVSPQIWVYSRFEMRVIEVISGEAKPGDLVVVYVPGGTKAKWGNPEPGGTFKPSPGAETIRVEYPGFASFRQGHDEIIFLQSTSIQDGTPVLWSPPEGRYELRNGLVASIFVDVPADPSQIADGDAKAEVVGRTLEDLRSSVREAAKPRSP